MKSFQEYLVERKLKGLDISALKEMVKLGTTIIKELKKLDEVERHDKRFTGSEGVTAKTKVFFDKLSNEYFTTVSFSTETGALVTIDVTDDIQ